MMRLIDAEVLKEEVSKGSILIEDDVLECETVHEIMVYVLAKLEDFVLKKIDEQPTVYDVDKVVEELEAETTALEDDYGDYVECIPESIVLKIVKGGGMND